MSFLPYAPLQSTTWAAAVSGSTAVHGGVLFALLTSSVALLPEPSLIAVREPDYEITLEILDADLITLDELPDPRAIPEDAIALEPTSTEALVLEALTPDALAPLDDFAALEPESDALGPLPDLTTLTPEATLPDLAALEPAPMPLPEPDVLAIDDLSPVDDTIISPLAEGVAPAPLAEPVAPTPEVTDQVAAVVVPDPAIVTPEVAPIVPNDVVLLPDATPEAPALAPEEITPELVVPDAVLPAPIAPDAAEPDVPAETDLAPEEIVAEPPTPEAPELPVIEETLPDTSTTGLSPNGQPLLDNPSASAQAIGTLLQRIRTAQAPQCTIALPRRAGTDGVGVAFIGADQAQLDGYAARVLQGLPFDAAQSREILDPRQCAMLDALRLTAAYPASRIGLSLSSTVLGNGDTLQARVTGAGGLFLTLLLVDDNGVVQDLARFTTLEGDIPVIDAPIARIGPARSTRQALIVLGSSEQPIDVSAAIGRTAQEAFTTLSPDVLRSAVFGMVTFEVR